MNTEKIYEQIYKLLEDFFGKDSNVPAFYLDAWSILNNSHLFKTSSHLIAHCLREVESAIRETLSRHLLEKRRTKREEINGIIESVLHIIGDDKKEELNKIGEKWFNLLDNLHTYVHRNNIDSPRSIEEVKERFKDFNEVFSVLLPYLSLYVHKIKQKIDELINSGNKSNVLEAFGKLFPKIHTS
jgi:hypothetical protein